MNLSERASRVIRNGIDWQPLRMSMLSGARARPHAGERERGADVEARIAAAFQDGLAEGRYQANAEAEEREKQVGLSAQQRWGALLGGLESGVREIESAMADRLLDLTALLAARIACREISQASDRIEPVLAEALTMITGAFRQLEVTAHPDDCPAIETWLRPKCSDSVLTIRADATLAPGGCLLRADDATLDASLQTRIERTLAAVGIETAEASAIAGAAVEAAANTVVADPSAATPPGQDHLR